jgi:uncharacterized repeat protein (TIGR01451 family)/fimbrial isopeptide formation D2 family protein
MPSFSCFCGLSLRLTLILSLPLTDLMAQTMLLPVVAQTTVSSPVTVIKTTSTPSVAAGGAATYIIKVTNSSGSTISNVAITDTLPTGFTYDATIGLPTLQNSATRTGITNPTTGSSNPNWGTFTLPATASVTITFVANIPSNQALNTYQNPVNVTYDGTTAGQTTTYNPVTSNGEDVTVTAAPTVPAPAPAPVRTGTGICAMPGKDGDGNTSGVINTYYPGNNISLNPGTQTMSMGIAVGLSTPITPGDLLLIIQMQDATIDSSNTSSYGSGIASNNGSGHTSLGNSGLYEYVVATNKVPTSGGALTFQGAGTNGGLLNTYTNDVATATRGRRQFQVIRVPQYSNLTLNNTVSSREWDGFTGGIILMDVAGQLNLNSRTIDGKSRGFRGGYLPTKPSGNSTLDYRGILSLTNGIGSGKGEGIAGTPQYVWNGTTALNSNTQGYPNGDVGRGAPGNAGGGGNIHNAGGGGGGNGGMGGQGGIPWEGAGGAVDSGGRGGAIINSTASLNRLVLGGGGGGGDANNATNGVRGGVGAGIVLIRSGTIVGTGTIDISGSDGDPGVFNGAPDGAGGGGAGGSIYISARQNSAGANITINAKGGAGGNTLNDNINGVTAHGPGGGGGGGVIVQNVPGATLNNNVAGGANGKTGNGAGIDHGASSGTSGQIVAASTTSDPFATVNDDSCLPLVSIWKNTTTPQILQGGKATYKITVNNAPGRTTATDVNIKDVLPTGFTFDSELSVLMDAGVTRTNPVSPTAGNTTANWGTFSIPTGKKVEITFQALASATIAPGTYNNPASTTYYDPKRLTPSGTITTNYDAIANSGEDVKVIAPPIDPKISGTVFEDPNYGGGAGRQLGTTGTIARPGAVVELYDTSGNFVATTTTDTNGKYIFTVGSGNFQIRVVNRTVTSSRTLTTPAPTDPLLPVQTFRTIGTSGAAIAVVDRVGGEKPENSDPAANTGTQTIAALNAITQSEVLSLSPVTVGTTNINGLDFGFNFDTIVNTRDTGQGSLRQFVTNSNAFSNTGLAQVGQTAGKEVSIFMIPLPTGLPIPPGLRTGLTNQLTTAGVAIIKLGSTLKITDADTSIDGRTQTTNVGNSNSLTLGTGGNVGVDNLSLAKLNAPEVEFINSGSVIHGITVDGANATIQGIAIHGFGTVGNNRGDILLQGANPLVTQNAIGFTANSFTAPAANQSQSGIVINGSTNANITKNIIGFTNERGILGGRTAIDLSGLVISENEIKQPGNVSGTAGQHSAIELFPSTNGNISITRNLLIDSQADSGIAIRPAVSGTSSNFLVQNNSILRNGAGNISGFGILLQASGTNDLQGIQIDKNILNQNRRGIDSQQTAVTISGNTVSNSLGGYGVAIEAGKQKNKITQNSIFGNIGVGIDLGNTANDITPNNGTISTTISNSDLDYPLITSATLSGGILTTKGYVGNNPAGITTFGNLTLEFFIADNTPADQNGEVVAGDTKSKPHGEGKTYIGSCTTDAKGIFGNSTNPCVFSNAGTLGLTAATNITATATDSNGNTSEFSASPSSKANLVLVKRITAINSAATGLIIYNSYIHESGSTKDNDPGWTANYLLGEINAGQVRPGDEIEYTIYYLNNGENRIGQAKVCDALNKNLDFVLNFNSSNLGKGILLSPSSSTSTYLTNTSGDDRGEYSTTSPNDCNLVNNITADRSTNTVVVDAANNANPILGGGYGSIKFKVTVKN